MGRCSVGTCGPSMIAIVHSLSLKTNSSAESKDRWGGVEGKERKERA